MTALNYADKIAIGSAQATAVYVGSTKVWPPFKPTNLSGCCVWMDASKLTMADGAAVSAWTNLGSGSQPTITAGATLRRNALYNVMPVVRITQGTGKMRWYSGTGVDKDWTLIYIGRRWQLRGGRVVAAFTTSANFLVGFHGNEFDCAYLEGWLYSAPGPVGGITANTDWKMYSSDASTGGPGRLFSDGVYLGQFYSPAKGWGGTLCISGYTDDTTVAASQEADCEIAELIMYNRKLSDAERQQIEAYLRYKWAPITAFKPTNLSGCVIWQDASQLALANGANVTSWPNLGTGPAPAFIGSPPATMRTNALSGKGVVRFTGAQGRARFTGTGITTDYTIAIVARRWSTRVGRVVAAALSQANILFGFWSTRFDCVYVEGWGAPDNVHTDNLDWRIYTVDTTSAAAARLFKDGAVLRTTAAAPAKGVGGTLNFCGHDDVSTEDADCEIAEVVMYNRKLTDPERTQVEQYLRLKWNPPPQTFKPLDLGVNLTAWFDAADAGTAVITGQGVSQWINKGAGAMTLTQTTDANRPAFSNRAVIFADTNVLNGTNAPAQCDVIWVGKPIAYTVNSNWRTLIRNATSPHLVILENTSARFGVYNGGFFPAGALTWGNVYGIGFGRFGDGVAPTMSRDGGPLTAVATTIATGNAAPSNIGAYMGPPPSQGWGELNEMIILPYNTADNIRQMLEGYLAWKWGLVSLLPAGHPYKAAAP